MPVNYWENLTCLNAANQMRKCVVLHYDVTVLRARELEEKALRGGGLAVEPTNRYVQVSREYDFCVKVVSTVPFFLHQ